MARHSADGITGSGYLVQRDGVALIQDNGVHSSFEIDLQKEAVKTVLMQAEYSLREWAA
jgi:hypothetical protein